MNADGKDFDSRENMFSDTAQTYVLNEFTFIKP